MSKYFHVQGTFITSPKRTKCYLPRVLGSCLLYFRVSSIPRGFCTTGGRRHMLCQDFLILRTLLTISALKYISLLWSRMVIIRCKNDCYNLLCRRKTDPLINKWKLMNDINTACRLYSSLKHVHIMVINAVKPGFQVVKVFQHIPRYIHGSSSFIQATGQQLGGNRKQIAWEVFLNR